MQRSKSHMIFILRSFLGTILYKLYVFIVYSFVICNLISLNIFFFNWMILNTKTIKLSSTPKTGELCFQWQNRWMVFENKTVERSCTTKQLNSPRHQSKWAFTDTKTNECSSTIKHSHDPERVKWIWTPIQVNIH